MVIVSTISLVGLYRLNGYVFIGRMDSTLHPFDGDFLGDSVEAGKP
jgi:hypothetical protein